jgi:hypothetical protein
MVPFRPVRATPVPGRRRTWLPGPERRWPRTRDASLQAQPTDQREAGCPGWRSPTDHLPLKPLQPLLEDPDVWEIMVNAPDLIFARRHQGPSGYHDEVFHDDDHTSCGC